MHGKRTGLKKTPHFYSLYIRHRVRKKKKIEKKKKKMYQKDLRKKNSRKTQHNQKFLTILFCFLFYHANVLRN